MSCERYKTLIVEAAAAGEVGAPLRLHLEGCAECRAAFADEQSLFSAIDVGLSQRMNVAPSAEFLPHVRAAVDLEPSDRSVRASNVWFRWLPIAGATVAACLTLLFVVRHHSLTPERQQPATNALAQEPAQAQVHAQPVPPEPGPALRAMASPMKRSVKRELQVRPDRIEPEPEILVPPDERIALAGFVAVLERRNETAVALTKLASATPSEDLTTEPLEIAELKVEPLSPEDEK